MFHVFLCTQQCPVFVFRLNQHFVRMNAGLGSRRGLRLLGWAGELAKPGSPVLGCAFEIVRESTYAVCLAVVQSLGFCLNPSCPGLSVISLLMFLNWIEPAVCPASSCSLADSCFCVLFHCKY